MSFPELCRDGLESVFRAYFWCFLRGVGAAADPSRRNGALVASVVALAFVAAAYFAPRLLSPLNWIWFKLRLALHHVFNPIIMALIFYGAILPTALILCALGKDLLRLERDPQTASYWTRRETPAARINDQTVQETYTCRSSRSFGNEEILAGTDFHSNG